jgi:hypothetical protein
MQTTARKAVFDRLGGHAEIEQLAARNDPVLPPHQIPKPGGGHPSKHFRGHSPYKASTGKTRPRGRR